MNRKDLIDKLGQAKPFLMTQDFIPILTHFCFDGSTLTAYNDIAGISLVFDSSIEGAVPGTTLIGALNTFNADTLRITSKGEHLIRISASENDYFDTPILSTEEFIFELPDIDPCELIKVPLDFLKGLEKTLMSIGDDPLHPERNGVTWTIQKDKITLYSTDAKTISMFEWKSKELKDVTPMDIITPKFFCEQLIALAKNYKEELLHVELYVSLTDNFVVADLNKICKIFTRLIIPSAATDYESKLALMPTKDEITFFEVPEELEPALDRAMLLNMRSQVDKTVSFVTIDGNIMNMRTQTGEGYNANREIAFDEEIGEFEFFLEPALLKRSFRFVDRLAILPEMMILVDNNNFTHLISYSN